LNKKFLKKGEGNSISIPLESNGEMQVTVNGRPMAPSSGINVAYLLIDCSVSMSGNKLQQTKDGAKKFAKDTTPRRKGYRIGLISFLSSAVCLFVHYFQFFAMCPDVMSGCFLFPHLHRRHSPVEVVI